MDAYTPVAEGRLLVLGAGTMGAQIALQAALRHVDVDLVDTDAEVLANAAAENRRLLARRVERGRLDAGEVDPALRRIRFTDDLSEAAHRCDWAIEAVPERLDLKLEVFTALDRLLPALAGIATNSSNIVSSRLAGATSRPAQVLNMHFFNPVLVMDVCEVVRGPHTSDAYARLGVAWARRIGRTPVYIERETDGVVVNRILGAASREAFALLADGVASPQDIDTAAKLGLNWRMGPFELADFTGLDVVLGVRRDRADMGTREVDERALAILERLVADGRLGRKSGRGFYDWSASPPAPLPLPE